jgi:hypothetical protein
MSKQSPFVKSNFPRRAKDHYPTIDTRCTDGIVKTLNMSKQFEIVDICADQGSAIVDHLITLGYSARGVGNAFQENIGGNFIITNTPYERAEVGPIMRRQIKRIDDGEIFGAAFLLKTGFDHAKAYADMFDNKYYYGQVKLRFRPWWTEDRSVAPIHNYLWHVWRHDSTFPPCVLYYTASYDPKYASSPNKKEKK